MQFEWDVGKAASNLEKHGCLLGKPHPSLVMRLALTISDPLHSDNEARFITLGWSNARRTLVVVHTYRDKRTRIISARLATPKERKRYKGR